MKKIYLALMCMASLSLMTACGDKKADKAGDAKENETEEVANNDEQDANGQEADEQEVVEESDVWGIPYGTEPLDLKALYANGDFKPAPSVIFEDTLSADVESAGELPTKWEVKEGSAEVGLANGHYFITMMSGNTVMAPVVDNGSKSYLPSKYTIEFEFMFGKDVFFFAHFYDTEENEVGHFNMWLENAGWGFLKNDDEWISGEDSELARLINRDGWNHFAASYDKGNMKLFINGKRIANMANVRQAGYFNIIGEAADGKSHYIRSIRVCK